MTLGQLLLDIAQNILIVYLLYVIRKQNQFIIAQACFNNAVTDFLNKTFGEKITKPEAEA